MHKEFESNPPHDFHSWDPDKQAWFLDWDKEYHHRNEPWAPHVIATRFARFSPLLREQERFVEQTHDWDRKALGKNLAILEQTVPQFDRLATVTIADDQWDRKHDFLGPHFPLIKWCTVWQDVVDLKPSMHHNDFEAFSHTLFITILQALGQAGKVLPCLYGGLIEFPTFEIISRLAPEDLQAVKFTVRNLTSIYLKLDNDTRFEIESENEIGQSWLAEALSTAERLENFGVALSYCTFVQHDFLKPFWTNITTLDELELSHVRVTENLFLAFLLKNSENTLCFNLYSVDLQDAQGQEGGSGWASVLRPLAANIVIDFIRIMPKEENIAWKNVQKRFQEDTTCADLLGDGMRDPCGEEEEEKFQDLCRALSLIHDSIPPGHYSIYLVGGVFPEDSGSDGSGDDDSN
ncbi:MAG: hypothetical protein Q9218_007860 [Villophora microphyllina]